MTRAPHLGWTLRRALAWLGGRLPELGLFGLGVALRLSMLRYPLENGYDYRQHAEYVTWMAQHWGVPPLGYNYEAWQPPAFYFVAGLLVRAGLPVARLGVIQAAFACARLVLVWIGLERFLRGSRLARCAGLALAAVVPCSIHIDGMLGNEPLSNLLSAAVLLTAPGLFQAGGRPRHRAVQVGVLLGLALLTKVTAMVLVGALGAAALVRLASGAGVRGTAPVALAIAIAFLTAGPLYGYNLVRYGKAAPTVFDGPWAGLMKPLAAVPYHRRRPLSFFGPCPEGVWGHPYWPRCGNPAYLFPVLLATTYADYASYGFAPRGRGDFKVNRQAFPSEVVPLARASVAGGAVISAVLVASWLAALVAVIRRRRAGELFLVLSPFLVFLGQIHFAVTYPFDDKGHVKGSFLLSCAPPLFGLFGLAVAWAWRRFRPAALVPLAALSAVAAYVIACRFVL